MSGQQLFLIMWNLILQAEDVVATWCNPSMGQKPTSGSTYACHGYAAKGCSSANPNV